MGAVAERGPVLERVGLRDRALADQLRREARAALWLAAACGDATGVRQLAAAWGDAPPELVSANDQRLARVADEAGQPGEEER